MANNAEDSGTPSNRGSTPGDLAASSLGFAVGFIVDLFLLPGGVTPGTFGGVCSAGALGLKKTADGLFKVTKRRSQKKVQLKNLATQAEKLRNMMHEAGRMSLVQRLDNDIGMWKAELLDDVEFRRAIIEIRDEFRRGRRGEHRGRRGE